MSINSNTISSSKTKGVKMKRLLDKKYTILCDIDDTLIYTNLANFLAYQKAIYEVSKIKISHKFLEKRCDGGILSSLKINDDLKLEIKALKDKYFKEFIKFTHKNQFLYKVLYELKDKKDIYILTNGDEKRINLLIDYYKIDKISKIYINKSGNKYKNCIDKFNLNPKNIIAIDDEEFSDIKTANIENFLQARR